MKHTQKTTIFNFSSQGSRPSPIFLRQLPRGQHPQRHFGAEQPETSGSLGIEEIEYEIEDEIHGRVQMMVEDERTHALGHTYDLF